MLDFDVSKMKCKEFIPSPEKKEKGWSYSFVYYLKDIKNIYNILYNTKNPVTISKLLTVCQKEELKSESGKQWTKRNLLEIVNALKNFALIDVSTNIAKAGNLFSPDTISLSEKDVEVFRLIYMSYFRFSEFHQMFESTNGVPAIVYAFKDKQRFFNRFARFDQNTLYCIEDIHQDTMRYWDVYTKWGETLDVLNKCSLISFNIETSSLEYKNIYMCNLTRPIPKGFSICKYIQEKIPGTTFYIPDVQRMLIKDFGFSINAIKKSIIEECSLNNFTFRLQKASLLTVDSEGLKLFPIVGNTYMSHILKIS